MEKLHFAVPVCLPLERHSVAAKAAVVLQGTEVFVDLSNISVEGLQILTFLALREGDRLMIRLPDRSAVGAEVRWARDGRAGLRFDAPLPIAEVEHIIKGYATRHG